ncbi:hypothetical protein [Sorangium sp. So ce887]|uniref:hypothetical protein n=1 Tax=Sorangium sp. So ce887 TaxID=3133324 RepID=UPI003F630068
MSEEKHAVRKYIDTVKTACDYADSIFNTPKVSPEYVESAAKLVAAATDGLKLIIDNTNMLGDDDYQAVYGRQRKR